MSETIVTRPQETITVPLAGDVDSGPDSPIYVVTANGENGLETEVIDVRATVPDAFPPRTVEARVVTDTASFLAEVARRPLIENQSTVWGNRKVGAVTVVYDELPDNAGECFTRRADRLALQFVADPDWATMLRAADGQFHSQHDFGDLIESAGHLITSHPAAELMEIVDSVRASSKGAFESRIRRETGAQHIVYSEEVSARAGTSQRTLEVPREITFAARPFEDYPAIEVTCWLRLRINQGQLALGLFPQPFEHRVRDAWTQVTNVLSEELGVPVYAANLGK
ncbi:DUF2303 family protein [Mycolicibacterium sp.]|uniref:DUF2303 family protein n=1 Tax=Mycolicibacterium sp. TaxID=2320850 RepID=UPI003561204B